MYIQITEADNSVMNKQSVKIAIMYDGSRTNVHDDESSGLLLVVTDGLIARIEPNYLTALNLIECKL